jgi:uncharacterized protein YkwD
VQHLCNKQHATCIKPLRVSRPPPETAAERSTEPACAKRYSEYSQPASTPVRRHRTEGFSRHMRSEERHCAVLEYGSQPQYSSTLALEA